MYISSLGGPEKDRIYLKYNEFVNRDYYILFYLKHNEICKPN